MVERFGIIENMKDDEELEMLLGEIPHAIHHHHHPSYANGLHHHHHVVNGNVHGNGSIAPQTVNRMRYGMYDDDDDDSSCSYHQNPCVSPATVFPSMFSNGHSSSDTSSSSSSSSSTLHPFHDPIPKPHIISRNPHSQLSESSYGKEVDSNLIDELDLSCNLGRMYINQDQNQGLLHDHRINSTRFGASNPPFPRIPINSDSELNPAFFDFQQNCGLFPSAQSENLLNYCYQWGILAVPNGLYCMNQIGMNSIDERGISAHSCLQKPKSNMNHDPLRFHHTATGGSSSVRVHRGGLEGLAASEDSLIIQGEDLSRIRTIGFGGARGPNKRGAQSWLEPSCYEFMDPCVNGRTKVHLSCSSHLAEAQRYIFLMAKDQHGCRLLQKIFDDGNPQHVQIVFNEIIGHVVELMINPFGNYLMQKLLEVCNEEQRMHILMAITLEPRELVQISLNTHGTRVVQKLIETLKTRQQVKLVISALEPGFLALIKDLNGNHVIQRCLQCLSNEDNKFIFEAAAKFCVEIATHQHGCCVLQRCINHSTSKHRENLISEISANGLLLAQDAFGNYVVQYILELQIPSAVSKLTSQFEGNYVHLAMQKFSSHVVEKCLAVLDSQVRSTIIRELISATHFEQLLQDPHANYVIQTALRVSEGLLHNSLVNAIESHKAMSRNSPYSKRIFSHKLLRR
ncbi:pumilio homolog 12-like [Cynara cardunculus var. scolymus]|uniref:pumilio homolog 12-like n=1 Tax=Cynara cardunculus var. scolymus TaxID=59895 RepID=UPI000D630B25|nr:pumilio homolog 12-like [Cynara cardunculus var. scolymus]